MNRVPGQLALVPTQAGAREKGLALAFQTLPRNEGPTRTPEAVLLDRLERHAPEVYDHMRRTAHMAGRVSEQLKLTRGVQQLVVRTAGLHDVGKLAIPRELLRKWTPLEATERRAIREHVVVGYRLLRRNPELEGLALMVRATHEWHDGTGYPDGLAGEAIPLPARIVAVCDAFDAMTEARLYKPRLEAGDALEELYRWAGSQFDPAIVEALDKAVATGSGLGAQMAGIGSRFKGGQR
jgi:HD-GYP domain-containing protein (c-di-GMP phosphodiesterase class II)